MSNVKVTGRQILDDSIQGRGQGQETFKVRNLFRHLQR